MVTINSIATDKHGKNFYVFIFFHLRHILKVNKQIII